MSDVQFQKTIIDTIKDLLVANLPTGYFRGFFYGDPVVIPTSFLPCVMIEKLSTQISHGPTGMDRMTTSVMIKLAYNRKEDFGKTPDEILGVRKLEEFAEAIDDTTKEYSLVSVMGILRKNFTMGTVVLDQQVNIKYGVVPRMNDELTGECQIQVSFTQLRTVTGRV